MPDITVHTKNDGKTEKVSLQNSRTRVGRSSVAELCYPDDAGLSRLHLSIEKDGDNWHVRDLGSKNGTLLNRLRIGERVQLKMGDRIEAGHLVIVFDSDPEPWYFDDESDTSSSSTIVTDLAQIIGETDVEPDPSMSRGAALRALVRAVDELSGERPLPELFEFILNLAIEVVSAERGILITLDGKELKAQATRGEGFRISSTIRDKVFKNKESVLVRDTSADKDLCENLSIVEQKVRTLIAVPLQKRDQIIGLIYVDSPSMRRRFTHDDLAMLTVMANVAAVRIEQSRFAELEKKRQAMEEELRQGSELQRRYLPVGAPEVSKLELAGYNEPCLMVGGDYYDFFAYSSGRVALVLGDVAGKGLAAALMMMALQARAQVLTEEPDDLADTITRLNRITAAKCPPGRFITFFGCIVDPETGDLIYCNAGHNPPLIIRAAAGTYDLLGEGGPPLGILANYQYQYFRSRMEPGDVLAIYSDGITEAVSPNDEQFDTEQLAQTIFGRRRSSLREMIGHVNQAVQDWTNGAPATDDVTMIVARRAAASVGS